MPDKARATTTRTPKSAGAVPLRTGRRYKGLARVPGGKYPQGHTGRSQGTTPGTTTSTFASQVPIRLVDKQCGEGS